MRTMHTRSLPTLLAVAALAAACSPKDQGASAGGADSAGTTTGAAAPAPNVVTVTAKDFAFEAPKEIPAGMTTFRLVNDGGTFHHAQIVRLDSAKTFADLQQALAKPGGPPPRWLVFIGGPNAPDPKGESNATLDMAPGNYAILCFVDLPDGVPHVAKGMAMGLTVKPAEGSAAAAPAPTPDAVMTLADYSFTLSKPLTAGKRTIEVRTADGQQPHEVELIRLEPGKTAKDVLAWMRKMEGPPPGRGLGGVAATVPGVPVYFTADLTPGDYALICFLPDAKDGKPHFTHGMVQQVKVT